MSVKIDLEKCSGCGACVDACPSEALKLVDEKVVVDSDECVDCGVCVDECPEGALELE
jgi:ferredoxin